MPEILGELRTPALRNENPEEPAEIARAQRYREKWDSRIEFRVNQLRRFTASVTEFEQMWDRFRKIYDRTNYIRFEDSGTGSMMEFNEFFTPFDISDAGGYSASPIRLPRTKQSRRIEPGSGWGDPWV